MGEIAWTNMANLKKLTMAELLAFEKSPKISYEFYVLVKRELEPIRPIGAETENRQQKVWDAKKRKMVYGTEHF